MNTVEQFHDLIVNCQPIDLYDFKEVVGELLPLENCQQDPTWHGEIFVLKHTNMVMAETLTQMQNLRQGFPRIALYIAALLHDIGKPDTAQPKKNGYNSFHGHEKMGVWRAKEFLKKYFPEYNFRQRDLILNLVEYHGHPKRMIEDKSHDDRFKRLSLEVPTHLVYNLEIADFKGRIAKDIPKSLISLDAFKKRCEDMGIYGTAYQIPNSKHLTNLQYSIFRWNILMHHKKEDDQREIDRIIKLTDKPNPLELTLLVGVPGSGKTTYRNTITDKRIISMDDERLRLCGDVNNMSKNQEVFNNCFKELNKALKAGESVLVDATNRTRKVRKVLIAAARQSGASVHIIYWDLTIATLLERNAGRNKKVPDDIVWKFYKEIETPASYEADRTTIFDDQEQDYENDGSEHK
jgi:putative nucleotidyltransferase with HDIG domain